MLGPPFLSVNTLIQFLTMLSRHMQQLSNRLYYAFEAEQHQVHRRMHLHTPLIQLMVHMNQS